MFYYVVNALVVLLVYTLNELWGFKAYDISYVKLNLYVLSILNIIISCVSYYFKKDSRDYRSYSKNENKENKKKDFFGSRKYIVVSILGFISTFVLFFCMESTLFHHQEYRNLAQGMKSQEFTKDMEIVDLENLPIVNSTVARTLADKKLGEIPSLGSQVTIGNFVLQKVNGHLYYVAPLEHTDFWKWNKNQAGTEGYIKVNATTTNDVQLVTKLDGKPIHLQYLDSSWFGSNLERHAFKNNNSQGLTDYTFEIDDNGYPYWTITTYKRTIGADGKKVTGLMLMDAQTGDINKYSIEDTPSWVDIIEPVDFVTTNINNWGELVNGPLNWSDTGKLKLTEGIRTIYDGSDCYYYAGLTSVGKDSSLTGFVLTNTRTNETHIYQTSGAIESAAQKSVSELPEYKPAGYKTTFPILINVQGVPTYFTTLLDSNGLIKAYAFVDVSQYTIIGHGDTLLQAYNSYVENLSKNTTNALTNTSQKVSVEGKIDRIGMFIVSGETYYLINLVDNEKSFIVPTEVSKEVCTAEKGDHIQISYIDNMTDNITASGFVNYRTK